METKQLIEQLEHHIKYHLAPYNLGDEGKTIELIKEAIALLCQLEPLSYASEAVPACGNCVLMPFCGIYKKWKEDEAEYFEKDIEDFYCKHFTASKPEA